MTSHNALLISAALLTAGLSSAQNVRDSQNLTPSANADFDPVVASVGDLTVVAYVNATDLEVRTSNGAGKSFNAAVRVDDDTTGARKDMVDGNIQIVGNNVYAIWNDRRDGGTNRNVYFSVSNDGGTTWAPNQLIDFGFGVSTVVRTWRLVATATGGPDAVYILASLEGVGSSEDVYLVASLTGGAAFNPAVYVPRGTTAGSFDNDFIDLAADGMTVHVVFDDNRNTLAPAGDDQWYQRSTDGGATWLAADLQIDSNPTGDVEHCRISSNGATVAIAFLEEPTGSGNEELRANVSTDGGTTFGGDVLVGGYTPGVDDVDNERIGITSTGNIIIVWEDNRVAGSDQIFASSSSDGGMTFGSEAQIGTTGGGFPRVAEGADGCDVVVWTGNGPVESSLGAFTVDGGLTWSSEITISQTVGDADFSEVAFNQTHGNIIVAWLADDSGANDVYVGGFRPQTIDPIGWDDIYNPAETTLGFDLSNFGDDLAAFVVLSGSAGPTPFASQSICLGADFAGLIGDPLFTVLPLVSGGGSTISVPNIFAGGTPFGIPVFFAAFGITAAGTLGHVTDSFSVIL